MRPKSLGCATLCLLTGVAALALAIYSASLAALLGIAGGAAGHCRQSSAWI
jgi:hypothetical protein